MFASDVIKIVTSCALYSRSMKSYVFHLLPLEQYKLGDTLAVNDVNSSCQIFANLDLQRPDEPEIKECFKLRPLFAYPQKLPFDTSDEITSMNFLFLMLIPIAHFCKSCSRKKSFTTSNSSKSPCTNFVKCFL